jgi:predicted aldo/keto reductase-like oxidoreductase
LKKIVDYYSWDVGQIQYNYMDTGIQATTTGLKYLHEKGIAVVVMEPLKGGLLANPPKQVRNIFRNAENQRTPVDWGLQFLWDLPEVSVVLSGMSSRRQVVENCASADQSDINSLTESERGTIQEITGIFRKGIPVPCTGCGYCEPCPHGVNIPHNFAMMNNMLSRDNSVMAIMLRRQIQHEYNGLAQSKEEYENTGKEGSSLLCVECGECVPKCPQSINIPEELKKVNGIISKQKISVKEIFKLMSYAVRNWRTVLSHIRHRGFS